MGAVAELGAVRGFRERGKARWQRWVTRQIPAARSVTLDHRRIFIFPSRTGLFFLFCLVFMLLGAVNYQNNMSFALVFLLANLFVIAILHTFANLSGLTITAVRAGPVFAGQRAEFEVMLSRKSRRDYYALHLKWPGSDSVLVSLTGPGDSHVKLYLDTQKRGWCNPGRLLVESTYPLGLLRAWTWVDLDIRALVYPVPRISGPLPEIASVRPDGSAFPVPGSDDFYGMRNYARGDSPKQVFWKSLAKGQPLQTKQYTAYADPSVWLGWELFEGMSDEQRLSQLCYWVMELNRSNAEYGLRMPGVTIAPASGEAHRLEVLRQLALYRLPPDDGSDVE
jgi:uncharacterized protein (DUF58 family)